MNKPGSWAELGYNNDATTTIYSGHQVRFDASIKL